jgi:hypothetical protein
MIKSRKMRWVGHATRKRPKRNAYNNFVGETLALGRDRKIILK